MLSVPFLRKGTGATPTDGGCVMQIVDWVAQHRWTDSPACVHLLIRSYAIGLNDALSDEPRQRLLGLIPKMMNTAYYRNGRIDPEVDGRLQALGRSLNEMYREVYTRTGGPGMDERKLLEREHGYIDAFEWYLDKFNEIIDHTPSSEMPDLSDVCAVMQPA